MAKQSSYTVVDANVGDTITGIDSSDTTDDPLGSTKRFRMPVWKRDVVSFSAGTSSTWSIPANCKSFRVFASNVTTSTAGSQILAFELLKASDGLAATFGRMAFAAITTLTDYNSTTSAANIWDGASTDTIFGADLEVSFPRSSSDKTRVSGSLFSYGTVADNHELRSIVSIAATAEDHDTLKISVDAGTMTGDFIIEYLVA